MVAIFFVLNVVCIHQLHEGFIMRQSALPKYRYILKSCENYKKHPRSQNKSLITWDAWFDAVMTVG